MRYISTRGQAPARDFASVLLVGLAEDGGLFVPETWPRLGADEWRSLRGLPYPALAARIIQHFVGDAIAPATLEAMCGEAYAGFSHSAIVPLVQLETDLFVQELFHGPTLAFKDMAMQLLGRLFDHVLAERDGRVTIVGATSGDTGSAAIEACAGRDRIAIAILHPHGRTSEVQRRQMTTVAAANVVNIAVEGTFDDCQDLVKAMFADAGFRREMHLSAVNSINWARIAAQIPYYFAAALALGAPDREVAFAVPTGNFGNVLAAWAARRMGLPVRRLIVAANRNDILARFLASNDMSMRQVEPSLSPSMDIQVSSNFERLLFELLDRDAAATEAAVLGFRRTGRMDVPDAAWRRAGVLFHGFRLDDPGTEAEIRRLHAATGYLADPHTAIGIAAASVLAEPGVPTVAMGTAHPAKFPDAMERATGHRPPLPPRMADLFEREERFSVLPNDLGAVQAAVRALAGPQRRLTRKRVWHPICTADKLDDLHQRNSPPVNEAIRVTRLPSGLTVVTERMDRVETVSFGAYVATGTRNETEAENGVSHFLEHMAFKGTERRSAAAIAEEIEAVGGHINAYTAREQTAYYVKVLKEDTTLAADIIGDILTHSTFEPEELERERGVILQEIGQANDTPDDIIFDHFQETAFPSQPMGRPVLGTEERIREMPRSVLTSYMRRHYASSNVVVAAAGAMEHEQVLDLVQKHFADLPGEAVPPLVAGSYEGGEFREARELDQVHIVLGFPSVAYGDPDYYPTLLLSTLLGGGMSSRLFQEIREKRGLVYSIYSFSAPYMDTGLFGIYAGTGESEAEELVPVTLAELCKVQTAVTEAELARAKAQVKASLLMSLESTGSRCEQLARQLQVFGRVVPTAETVGKLTAVTAEQVSRAAERLFRASPTLATMGPAGRVPALDSIAGRLAA